MDSKRLIIGLGTGRCGTTTIKDLLTIQDRTVALHEHLVLPWEINLNKLYQCLEILAKIDSPVVAGIAFYYLPYLDNIRRSLSQFGFQELRIIALQRNCPDTVKSYMLKTEGLNHWQLGSSSYRKEATWDPAYPKYSYSLSKKEAIEEYWKDYYAACEHEKIAIFPLESLNSFEGQIEILSACGFDAPRTQLGIKSNVAKKKHLGSIRKIITRLVNTSRLPFSR